MKTVFTASRKRRVYYDAIFGIKKKIPAYTGTSNPSWKIQVKGTD